MTEGRGCTGGGSKEEDESAANNAREISTSYLHGLARRLGDDLA